MNRTSKLSFVLVLATATACGTNEPTPPGGGTGGSTTTGGKGGSASGGQGGGGTGGLQQSSGGTGGSDAGGGTGGSGTTGDYFPFKVGNTWEYAVTEPGAGTVTKVNTIVRMEPVGAGPDKDVMAYYVETRKKDVTALSDATYSWQIRQGSRIVRYREVSCVEGSVMYAQDGTVMSCNKNEEATWSPPRVRIDEKPTGMEYVKGLKWPETYTESKVSTSYKTSPPTVTPTPAVSKTENWEVVDVGVKAASTAAPSGEFSDCVVLKKTSAQDVPKTYTFCRGVGKVREEGSLGQVEQLTKYTIP